jgi:hypothetical protein
MKKFVVLLVGLLIMAFGATVYAQNLEFKASGYLDVLGILTRNVPEHPYETSSNAYGPGIGPQAAYLLPVGPEGILTTQAGGGAFDRNRGYMASRGRLKFDAVMGKDLMGTIWLEVDSTRWGEVSSGYAGSFNDQRNNAGQWGADRGSVEIKNMNITFNVPSMPVPVTVQAGILPVAYRPHILAYVDATGVEARVKLDPANIRFTWAKGLENQDYSADDVDVYAADANVKIGSMTVGGFGFNLNAKTWPFPPAAIYTYTAATGGLTVTTTTPQVNYMANLWWLGLYADGKAGPINLNFDLIFNRGAVEDHRDWVARAPDVKYRGWATMLKADYPWEKFNFGLITHYASGADTEDTAANATPGSAPPGAAAGVFSKRNSVYTCPPGAEVGLEDYSMVFFGTGATGVTRGAGSGYLGGMRGQIGGTWSAQLYGAYKATPWYKITLKAIYIGDTTDNGNTIGTARSAPYGAGDIRDDNTIGWEFDLMNEIQIYKNLKFFVAGGYLFAGNAMDYFVGAIGGDPARNVSPKNPWAIYTKLAYSF